MECASSIREQIAAEAIDWHIAFEDEAGPAPDRQAFTQWLLRSPVHIEEYLAVSGARGASGVPDSGALSTAALIAAARQQHPESVNVVPLRGGERPARTHARAVLVSSRRGPAGWLGLAAAVLLGFGLWIGHRIWSMPSAFETVAGEHRSVLLSDGSVVDLGASSEVRVRWTARERHIDLVRGEARFQVARDLERPFIVATSRATVRAVGTIFDVRAYQTLTRVAVIEGRVEVRELLPATRLQHSARPGEAAGVAAANRAERAELVAGERADVTSEGIESGAGSLEAPAPGRRLVFREEPLAAVVSEFNRHGTQRLVLDDPRLAALKISGSFELSDPDSLIAYLMAFESVRVRYTPDGAGHLSGAPPEK